MSGVLRLHRSVPADDVVGGLRLLADEIERGEVGWPVSTAVVCLGHAGGERREGDNKYEQAYWRCHGYGPRTDTFTVRGLLASVIHNWGYGDD